MPVLLAGWFGYVWAFQRMLQSVVVCRYVLVAFIRLVGFLIALVGYGGNMVDDSLSFTQQVVDAPKLDDEEVDQFLSLVSLMFYEEEGETIKQVEGWFRSMSGASQRLLVRGHSSGFLSAEFVNNEMRFFDESVLDMDWLGTGRYASLLEAFDFYDARLSSVLLAWERLGSSLEPLGLSLSGLRQLAGWVLNGYKGYSSAAGLRVSAMSDVESLADLITYCAVDAKVEKELRLGFDGRGVIVDLDFDVFPLANEEVGQNSTSAKVVHGELEGLLRGRSLDEYLMANWFVRERALGNSSEEAQYVVEHLAVESRPMSDGFL